jgi:hypothetical protein
MIKTKKDQTYAGIILGKNGNTDYHLVLLPDIIYDASWDEADQFAKKLGGALPNRSDDYLLMTNCREEMGGFVYWSSEAMNDGIQAWSHDFHFGSRIKQLKNAPLRARVVLKIPFQSKNSQNRKNK